MSTRGAVGVKVGGKYKVTYNHCDSYPEGLGKEVVDFCQVVQEAGLWDQFKKRFNEVELVDENSVPSPELQKKYRRFANLGVSNETLEEWYCLLRNLQGIHFLEEILNGIVNHMIDSFEFLKDSLLCEYAYIINLDDMTLEFYQGDNHSPQEDNPLPFEQISSEGHYPVRYMGSFLLDNIPENWTEKIFAEEKVE